MSKHAVSPVHPECRKWFDNNAVCNCLTLWGGALPKSPAGNREIARLTKSEARTRWGRHTGLSVRQELDDEENGVSIPVGDIYTDGEIDLDSSVIDSDPDELAGFWKDSEFRKQFDK